MSDAADKRPEVPPEEPGGLMDALQEARETAREELEAAWRIHIARVEEQLGRGWQEHIEGIFEERFAELADRVGAEVDSRVSEHLRIDTAAAVTAAERRVRRRVGEQLADLARRLQEVTGEREVVRLLLESARELVPVSGLYVLSGSHARFFTLGQGSGETLGQGSGESMLLETELLLTAAPAAADAARSRDCVVAMHSRRQLSAPVAELLPAPSGGNVTLIPVLSQRRVVAVFCAGIGGEELPLGILEAIAALGGAALASAESPEDLVSIAASEKAAEQVIDVTRLSDSDQELHLRARRVARVHASEIRLYKSKEVKQGRSEANLYAVLKSDIDSRRDAFRKEFLDGDKIGTDYFHLELIRTLANDDESLLGPDYPGPLV